MINYICVCVRACVRAPNCSILHSYSLIVQSNPMNLSSFLGRISSLATFPFIFFLIYTSNFYFI